MDVSGQSREECEAQSRGCEYCSGCGMASIWHADFRGAATEMAEGRQRCLRTVAYCVCPVGRWILMSHQRNEKSVYRRTPDLYEVISGRVLNWCVDNPRQIPDLSQQDMKIVPHWRKFLVLFVT